ncbi:MAG: hypothetical protein ACPGQL_04340 [Thermoplasmatota archaeon]
MNGLRRSLPLAIVLAVALAAAAVLGAHVYNAWPFRTLPYGRPGPGTLANGVALARSELILAASLPAMAMGLRARRPLAWPLDLGLIAAACAVAGAAAVALTSEPSWSATWAFVGSHGLLAWSFYALGALVRTAAPAVARLPIAAGAWLSFVALYENLVRWRLFRATGYVELTSGQFPDWFYATQALSPVAAYRGLVILWRPDFRDALERAALGDAAIPSWLGPWTMAGVLLVLWVAGPLGVAWWLHRRRDRRPVVPTPTLHEGWRGDDADWEAAWLDRDEA